MKSICIISAFAAAFSLCAAEPETILEMDMTKTANGTLGKWVDNKGVNKTGKVSLAKDKDGKVFLTTEGWHHYYYPQLFPVNESDTLVVKIRARGKGGITPGYYFFGKPDKFFGANGPKFTLTADWKEFKAEMPVGTMTVKGVLKGYPNRVRPLIETSGEKIEFADYKISVIRNPILKEWTLDPLKSNGIVKAVADGVELSGQVEYTARAIEKANAGDKAVITMEVKGKGSVKAGLYLYDIKYNPGKKGDKFSGEVSEVKNIDSGDWTKLVFTVTAGNVKKAGTIYYINRILPYFSVEAKDSALIVKSATCKNVKEDLTIPEI